MNKFVVVGMVVSLLNLAVRAEEVPEEVIEGEGEIQEPVAPARYTATWKGGSGSWTDAANWSGHPEGLIPTNSLVDVVIDDDPAVDSSVDFTSRTSTTYELGSIRLDSGDSLKFTKNFNGSSGFAAIGLQNSGTVNVNAAASGNAQSVTLRVNEAFTNMAGAVVNVNGSTARNRTSSWLRLPGDFRNDGEINVLQASSDRNNSNLNINNPGTAVNNGTILFRITGLYSSSSTYSRMVFDWSDANTGAAILGSGSIILDGDREGSLAGGPSISAGSNTMVLTNGVNHTIRGCGVMDKFGLVNEGLVFSSGTNRALSVQTVGVDTFNGKPIRNLASGRMVSSSPFGLYIGYNSSSASCFINEGLLEARSGSFIQTRTGVSHSTTKWAAATHDVGGVLAGGGEFRFSRPVKLLDGARICPGDLANTVNAAGETVYGTGVSTCGRLSFASNLTMSAPQAGTEENPDGTSGAIAEFQCRKPEAGKYDSVWVNGDATVAGTLRFLEQPKAGTYPIFTSTGTLTCDLAALKIELADGVRAPKLKLNTAATYMVEEPVLDKESGEPVLDEETGLPKTQMVEKPCQRLEATWTGGFTVFVR